MSSTTPHQSEILAYLQKHIRPVHLRELARRLKLDAGNLSRELKVLAAQGVIIKTRHANLSYFSIGSVSSVSRQRATFFPSHLQHHFKRIEPDLIKFTQSLIRTPSIAGEQPEEKIAQLIFDKARGLGLFPRVVAKDRRRPNLVIDLASKLLPAKPIFLFLGHMDTIGIGEIDNWRYYPFSGHIAGGRIYGRGAADMKAGIACELFALKLIQDLKIELLVSPRILLVSNEEGGSTATPIFDIGMEHLIEEGLVEGTAAIYGYGGSYNLGIGHRGVLRVRLATQGQAMHTGNLKWQRKERGMNAVTAMAEILLALENIKLPQTKHPSFPQHHNVITPGTMILHGGTAVSTVPDFCESVVEVRYLPGLDIRRVYHQIKEQAEKIASCRGIKVELERFVNIPAVSLSPTEKLVELLGQVCQSVYGRKISARGTGPANESFMLIKKGIPTVVFGPLGGCAHADDEFIYVDSLTKTIQVYLLTLMSL